MTIDEAFKQWNESGPPESLDRECVVDELAFGAAAFRAGAEWAVRTLFDDLRYRTCDCPEDLWQLAKALGTNLDKYSEGKHEQ